MAKKYIHKALSVGLSLALCAGLVLPSFAASFSDLNNAINGSYTGNAFDINKENGKITLKEDVSYDQSKDGNQTDIRTNGSDVTLDLGGYTITGKGKDSGSSTIYVNGGSLTLEDSGRTDENDQQVSGKVTGGGNAGVYVDKGGSFTMNGGVIYDNAAKDGGGVNVFSGKFHMNGGEIRGNTATNGGGVAVGNRSTNASATFTMTGGKIVDNTATSSQGGGGGGVWVKNGSTFTMKNGEIAGNKMNGSASGGGGVGIHQANFIMNGGTIVGNTAAKGDGVQVHGTTGSGVNRGPGSFTMNGGTIKGGLTVMDEGGNAAVSVEGGNVSSLNDKYLEGKGLLPNADGETYRVVPHGESQHYYGQDGVCRIKGCDAVAPVEEDPSTPVTPTTPDEPVIDLEEDVIDIDDPAVPLAAGPVTRGEFIDYLWRHEDQPQAAAPTYVDVPADHEYASAIGWAQSIGILERVVVENSLDPDELVTVAAVRDILIEFAEYAGMEMPELTTLMGEDDEAVLNCDEILAEFFGEEPAE